MKTNTLPLTSAISTIKAKKLAGNVLLAIFVLFMAMIVATPLLSPQMASAGAQQLGFPPSIMGVLSVITVVNVTLYLIPRTALLGAILQTGYLGGAVAAHVRIGQPFAMPLIVAALMWGALYLRDPRVKLLFSQPRTDG